MKKDIYYPSCGKGNIHVCRWEPEGQVKGVVQIVHGIAEYAQRYESFANYLNTQGFVVVADDHMGHGLSIGEDTIKGYFYGGWFSAVEDSYQLTKRMQAEFPDVPYFLFGHSMGSFMARTMLIQYPDSGISGCILCGTGWMSPIVVGTGLTLAKLLCVFSGDTATNAVLHNIMFGAYNRRVTDKRTGFDWLSTDAEQVDRYIADPLCGFSETIGLARDMLRGILFIQKKKNLVQMTKHLPVFFIAGQEDPVGDYGKGVTAAADNFRRIGMEQVDKKLYPRCRHEILNERNREEIYRDVYHWILHVIRK